MDFPLHSRLYGIVDRGGMDTIVHLKFGDPPRDTLEGIVNSPGSMNGSVFVFVTDPTGQVTRAFFTAHAASS